MKPLNRREFVGSVVVGAGLAAVAGQAAADPLTALPAGPRSATQKVPLGRTGVQVSYVGIGTGVSGGNHSSNATRMGADKFLPIMRHAYDSGITFFDVADLYGTHDFLKQMLEHVPREKIQVQSKIWWMKGGMPSATTDATKAVERFLLETGCDHLDSVLLHCTSSSQWSNELKPMMDQLDECKQRGLVKSHGTSCHSYGALRASLASPWVDVQLARVNNVGRSALMDGTPDEISTHLRSMREAGKAVIGMKIYGEGRFKEPEAREASLKFVTEQKCIDAMVIGFEAKEHIDETITVLNRLLKA